MNLEAGLLAMFVAGLLSSGHCFGMCGGIAGALALQAGRARPGSGAWPTLAAHNLGRLATYAALGAAAGALAGSLATRLPAGWGVRSGRGIAALCFAGLALYLVGLPGLLAPVERAGGRLFRLFDPLRRRLARNRSFAGAVATGALWGLLPCGLVYSSLLLAATAGDAASGALSMLAFGAGTLPALVAASLASSLVARLARGAGLRRLAAAVYFAAALFLTHAALANPQPAGGGAPVCHTPERPAAPTI